MAFFAVSAVANAVSVTLIVHNQTSGGGAISSLITDGSHVSGIAAASTAVFDWDGTTLSSTGLYSAVSSIGSSPYSSTILADVITDLNIDVGTSSAAGTAAYSCTEGTFLGGVGANGCGGYTFGTSYTDDSTTIWGPGTAVSQTLGGDDVATAGPRTISAYDFDTFTLISGTDGLTPGDVFSIGNGLPLGVPNTGGEAMKFSVNVIPVPAAAWLFGSALGLLGWMRRRTAQ
jgi:hypothetical protein